MPMMTSQILKSVYFTKHKNLDISRVKHFSSNKKNHQLHIKVYFIAKYCFVAEVTFNVNSPKFVDFEIFTQLEKELGTNFQHPKTSGIDQFLFLTIF